MHEEHRHLGPVARGIRGLVDRDARDVEPNRHAKANDLGGRRGARVGHERDRGLRERLKGVPDLIAGGVALKQLDGTERRQRDLALVPAREVIGCDSRGRTDETKDRHAIFGPLETFYHVLTLGNDGLPPRGLGCLAAH